MNAQSFTEATAAILLVVLFLLIRMCRKNPRFWFESEYNTAHILIAVLGFLLGISCQLLFSGAAQ